MAYRRQRGKRWPLSQDPPLPPQGLAVKARIDKVTSPGSYPGFLGPCPILQKGILGVEKCEVKAFYLEALR